MHLFKPIFPIHSVSVDNSVWFGIVSHRIVQEIKPPQTDCG